MKKINCAYFGFLTGAILGISATSFISYQSKPVKLYETNKPGIFAIKNRMEEITELKLEEKIFKNHEELAESWERENASYNLQKSSQIKSNIKDPNITKPNIPDVNSINKPKIKPKIKKQKYFFGPSGGICKIIKQQIIYNP